MGLLDVFYGRQPFTSADKEEVDKLMDELMEIGKRDDFLSERPGGAFNAQCRHTRTRQIGQRFNEIGDFQLMEYAYRKVKKKLGANSAEHLEYAWSNIGKWLS